MKVVGALAVLVTSAACARAQIELPRPASRPTSRPEVILVLESTAGTERPFTYHLEVTQDGTVDAGRTLLPAFVPSDPWIQATCGNGDYARTHRQWTLSLSRRAKLDALLANAPLAATPATRPTASNTGRFLVTIRPTAGAEPITFDLDDPATGWALALERTLGVASIGLQSSGQWTMLHRAPDGLWHTRDFDCECFDEDHPACDGAGSADWDIGVTALNLTTLLARCSPSQREARRPVEGTFAIDAGFRALARRQDADGSWAVSERGFAAITQAWATLAFCERAAVTTDLDHRRSTERAIAALVRQQNADGSWTFATGTHADTATVTAWAILACLSGSHAGLTVEKAAIDRGLNFLTTLSIALPRDAAPRSAPPLDSLDDVRIAAAAAAAITRYRDLIAPGAPSVELRLALEAALPLLQRNPPTRGSDGSRVDYNTWLLGWIAAYSVGDDLFSTWNGSWGRVANAPDGERVCAPGSADPLGPWSAFGGRAWSTAMTKLIEVHWARFPRAFGQRR